FLTRAFLLAPCICTLSLHDALPIWRGEAEAVGPAESEADPGHPLGAVAPVGVEFTDHPVQVDALVGECAQGGVAGLGQHVTERQDRKSTRLNSSHVKISYAVVCL